MRLGTTRVLACPACRESFATAWGAATGGGVRGAWLECPRCLVAVPIVRGFPVLAEAELGVPDDPKGTLESLDERLFGAPAAYRRFLLAKEHRPAPDVYAAYQPFNEATRAIDPLIGLLREQLEPGDVVLDLWCRTGWSGALLAALFPEQTVVSLWEGASDVLGYRGFDFWLGDGRRAANWDVVFASAREALPIRSDAVALVHGFDVLHRYPPVPFVAECLRVARKSAPLVFPHVHLTNNEPDPFFERGEIQRHGLRYRQYFDRLLRDDPRTLFVLSERTLYENDPLTLEDEADTDHYNACLLIANRRHTGRTLAREHAVAEERRAVVNPLFASAPTQRSVALSRDALGGGAAELMERHPMVQRRLAALGAVELSVEERLALYEARLGRPVRDLSVPAAVLTGLEAREIVRVLGVAEADLSLHRYFAEQVYDEPADATDLSSLWQAAVDAYGDAPYLRWPEERTVFTYAEVDHITLRMATLLRDAGVRAGEHVVLWGSQHPEFQVAFWAVVRLGAVAVPLDAGLPDAGVRSIVQRTAARVLLALPPVDPPDVGCPVVRLGDGRAIAAHGPAGIDARPAPADPAVVLFTSGTTGRPKGVVLSHESLFRTSRTMLRHYRINGDDVLLFTGGPHTMSGLRNTCVLPVRVGASVVVQQAHGVHPLSLVRACEREGVTVLSTAPGFLSFVLGGGERVSRMLARSPLRRVLCTGSRLAEEDRRAYEERFGVPVHDYYGLTETGGACVFGTGNGGLGVPVDCVATVFGPDGREVSDGEIGELGIAGPALMLRYLDDAGGARARRVRGHLMTGDHVRRLGNGEIILVGRRDRMIAESSGDNLYPETLEASLEALDTVRGCHVARRIDAAGRESAVVLVQPAEPALLASEEWTQDIRRRAERTVVFVDDLPRRADGSVDVRLVERRLDRIPEVRK